MTLYKGSVFKDFLIDRAAMGFDFMQVKAEFDSLYGISLNESDYDTILAGCDDAIKKRELELMEEIKSQNVFTQLLVVKQQLEKARDIALENEDLKAYAALTNSTLKSIEITINGIEQLRKKDVTMNVVVQQNNYFALEQLQKDGLIQINDAPNLKKLLGAQEDEIDGTPGR